MTDAAPVERQIESRASGWTPIFDVVVHDVGLTGAMVFGKMWRYCQMETGLCYASKERLASESNMSTRSFVRWAKRLVKAGYLEDMTPDLKHKPHTYRDTGKVRMILKMEAVGMTESHTRTDRESYLGMTESHLKKQYKEQGKKATTTPLAAENLKTLLSLGCAENAKVNQVAHLEGLTPAIILGVYERGKRNRRIKNLCGWLLAELESGRWQAAQGYYSESELDAARAEALSEEPIDVDEYLRLDDEHD